MASRRKPSDNFTGMTLEEWHSDSENIQWAKTDPRFKRMLSVILNECPVAHQSVQGCSEGRAFGRVEGYHMALDMFRMLAKRPEKTPKLPDETYDEPLDNFKEQPPRD